MAVEASQASSFLVKRFGSEAGEVAPVGQGEWSKAYFYRRGGSNYVIRFSSHQQDFAKDRLATRHSSPDLPIPLILEVGEAFGGYYAISERSDGGYFDDLNEPRLRRVLPSFFAALDGARLADISASTGYGIWEADGNAPHATWRDALMDVVNDRPRIHGWRERMALSATGTGPFDEALLVFERLVDHVPNLRDLVHSDLLHFNVLVANDRIAAVIDWGESMYGDFLYDIAWLSFWAPWYRAWSGIDFAAEAAQHYESIGLAVPHFEARLCCYELHIGLSGQAYCAFAGHWDDLEWTAHRTLVVARQTP